MKREAVEHHESDILEKKDNPIVEQLGIRIPPLISKNHVTLNYYLIKITTFVNSLNFVKCSPSAYHYSGRFVPGSLFLGINKFERSGVEMLLRLKSISGPYDFPF